MLFRDFRDMRAVSLQSTDEERFLAMAMPEPNSGCWLWLGSALSGPRPYGRFRLDGRSQVASRAAYQLFIGTIPGRLCVCHRCDMPLCVNPEHLFLGTHKENSADRIRKCRGVGEGAPNVKLTAEHVLAIRKSDETNTVLGERYGVTDTNIIHIRTGNSWRWLNAAA